MSIIAILNGTITTIFLLVILSYYVLFFVRRRKPRHHRRFSKMTVIIPAHNEALYIADCIRSVQASHFNGKKEIIVVDDGSIDDTYAISKEFESDSLKVLQTNHSGKSATMNMAMRESSGDLIAVVDGDSTISPNALEEMAKEVSRRNVAAATCIVKVKNRRRHIGMWLHVEQIYNSLIRSILAKVNANITTPGPLSVYRRKELEGIGGFSTEGFSEDLDVTIRLIRKGYRVTLSEDAYTETNMPLDPKGFLRQRTRFARGMLNIFKRHLKLNRTLIDLYTLPVFAFTYIQGVVMGSITLYKIISGYLTYYAGKGVFFSFGVVKFLFGWFSLYGFFDWTVKVATGVDPLTFISAVGIFSTLLSYPMYLYAFLAYDRRFDIWHAIPFFFMFPFWFLIMIIYIICLPEIFRKKQYNIWKKNE